MGDATFEMPPPRDFGWTLKPAGTSLFDLHVRANGQLCIVLNHALVRGVTAAMIDWWFSVFPALSVRLEDIAGYEGRDVPAYYLWHPTDHHSATVTGAADGAPQIGAELRIREAFQVPTYGLRYPVDQALTIEEKAPGLWAMGKRVRVLSHVLSMRIRYADVVEDGVLAGVHYHYEVVIGVSLGGPIGRAINRRITKTFSQDLFSAWHLHNVQEVGTFENFLPALSAQRGTLEQLRFRRDMAPDLPDPALQTARGPDLFAARVAGYRAAADPFAYQAAPGLDLA